MYNGKKTPDIEFNDGIKLEIPHQREIKKVVWHYKGDYLATVSPDAGRGAVLVHQLTKGHSQNPFSKSKGIIETVSFHPTKPFFFVATQRFIRIYNLVKQQLSKKLQPTVKWISAIAIHPSGDHVIMGSYDKKVAWFDLDLSTKPYKLMRYHKMAVRSVSFHQKYPLFASTSDDGTVHIFHGTVYSDLLKNPLIVPLKVLRGHEIIDEFGVLDCVFHPLQPWIFSAGADKTIRLFT